MKTITIITIIILFILAAKPTLPSSISPDYLSHPQGDQPPNGRDIREVKIQPVLDNSGQVALQKSKPKIIYRNRYIPRDVYNNNNNFYGCDHTSNGNPVSERPRCVTRSCY